MKISKKYALSALVISASCMLSTFTQAASNTITFNGTVSDTTCTATIDGLIVIYNGYGNSYEN